MTKSDLKAGQKLVCKDNKEFIYFPYNIGYELISFSGGSDSISCLSEDLKNIDVDNAKYDVLRVFECKDWTFAFIFENHEKVNWTQIWERDSNDVKEVTMKDVESKFGCKIKIIRETKQTPKVVAPKGYGGNLDGGFGMGFFISDDL